MLFISTLYLLSIYILSQEQLKPFYVIIPHQIRAFIRSTGGLVRGEAPKESANSAKIRLKIKERKNFDPVPRYSTVLEEFQKGQEGLIELDQKLTAKEIALQQEEEAKKVPDWGLTYGKKKVAKVNP